MVLRAVARGATVAALVVAASCSDEPPPDGWVSVAEGDTYGEWEMFVEVEDGAWTGCIRFDYEPEAELCSRPDEVVVHQDLDGAYFGAVPDGRTLVYVDSGEPVATFGDGLDLGVGFYLTLSEVEER